MGDANSFTGTLNSGTSTPTQPAAPTDPATGSFVGALVKDNTKSMDPSMVQNLPNTAGYVAMSPNQQADYINTAYNYVREFYGDDAMNALQIYAAPASMRPLLYLQNLQQHPFDRSVAAAAATGGQVAPALMKHFQTILLKANQDPASVLSPDMLRSLDAQAKSFNDRRLGYNMPGAEPAPGLGGFLGEIKSRMQTWGDYVGLDAEWVHTHPAQAIAVLNYVNKVAPGLPVKIQGEGFGATLVDYTKQGLSTITMPVSIGGAIVGAGLNTVYNKLRKDVGEPLAHTLGFTQQEIDAGYKSSGIGVEYSPAEVAGQFLDSGIPGAGYGGFFTGAFGLAGNDPRAATVEMIAGAIASEAGADPFILLGKIRAAGRLAEKLPIGEAALQDTEGLQRLAEAQKMTNWLQKKAFIGSLRSIEDVTTSPRFTVLNDALSRSIAGLRGEEAVAQIKLNLRKLGLPMTDELANDLAKAAGKPEEMTAVWQKFMYGGGFTEESVSAAQGVLRTARAKLQQLTDSINSDTHEAQTTLDEASTRDLMRVSDAIENASSEYTMEGIEGEEEMAHQASSPESWALKQEQFEAYRGNGTLEDLGNNIFKHIDARGVATYYKLNDAGEVVSTRLVESGEVSAVTKPSSLVETPDARTAGALSYGDQLLDAHWTDAEVSSADDMIAQIDKQSLSSDGRMLNARAADRWLQKIQNASSEQDRAALLDQYDQLQQNILNAQDVVNASQRPLIMRYPDFKQVLHLRNELVPQGPLGKVMDIIIHGRINLGEDMGKMSAALDRWNTKYPVGKLFNPEFATAAEREQTINNVVDMLEYMRMPQSEIRRIVAAYGKITDGEMFFQWDKMWRTSVADQSPILDSMSRESWRTVYQDAPAGPNYRGLLTRVDAEGRSYYEPVGFSEMPATNGQGTLMNPVALEPAEWSRHSYMPSGQMIRDSVSTFKKLVKRMPAWTHQAGEAGSASLRAFTYLHRVIDETWAAAMIAPRNAFRMLFARIMTENTAHLIAAGRGNIFDGADWMNLVRDNADVEAALADPQLALGTLADQLVNDVSFKAQQAKIAISPGDQFYGRAFTDRMGQLSMGSPALTQALLDMTPQEALDWMRGTVSDVVDMPIDDVLAKAGAYSREADGTYTFHPEWMPPGSENVAGARDAASLEAEQQALADKIAAEGYDRSKPVIMGRLAGEEDQVSEGLHRLEALRRNGAETVPVRTVDLNAMQNEGVPLSAENVEARPGVMPRANVNGPGTYVYEHIWKPLERRFIVMGMDPAEGLARMAEERQGFIGGDPAMEEAMRTGFYVDPQEFEQEFQTVRDRIAADSPELEDNPGEIDRLAAEEVRDTIGMRINSRDFSDMIQQRADEARVLQHGAVEETMPPTRSGWTPPQYISSDYSTVPRTSRTTLFDWFDTHLKGMFSFQRQLVEPEMKWMRAPLWRELRAAEMERLKTVGLEGEHAEELASNFAAEQARAYFRDFTNGTAADRFMKQFAWFFPAWKNIVERWLVNLPKIRGEFPIGQISTARFAQDTVQLMTGLGFIKTAPDGSHYVTVPVLEQLLEHFTGYQLKFNPASFSLVSSLPGLNASILLPLSLLSKNDTAHRWIDHWAGIALPYGADAFQLAPSFANYIWEGVTKTTPPWEFTSRSTQEFRMTVAMGDAMNMAREKVGNPPDPSKYAQGDMDPKYRKDYGLWVDNIVRTGQQMFQGLSILHGLSMVISPFSFQLTPKWAEKTDALWQALSIFPNGDPVTSVALDQFNRMFPGANFFLTGKSITNGGIVPDTTDFTEWQHQVTTGMRTLLSPKERVVWAAGMEELSHLNMVRQNTIDQMGGNLEGVLNNYYKYRKATQEMNSEFHRYLLWNKDFANLWNTHKDDVPAGAGRTFFQTQALLEVRNDMSDIGSLFTDHGIVSGDYTKFKGMVSDKLDKLQVESAGTAGSAVAQDLQWYWTNVATPYYDKLSSLYEQLDKLPKAQQGPIYTQIRELNDAQKSRSYNGMTIPTPEEVSYNGLTPEAQKEKVAGWALGSVTYLDNFQLSKVYAKEPKLGELTSFMNQGDDHLQQWLAANPGVSTSSNEYKAEQARVQGIEIAKAQDLGLNPGWVTLNDQPPFVRLSIMGYGAHNDVMQHVMAVAREDWNSLISQGVSPKGGTLPAVQAQARFVQMVNDYRDPNSPRYNKNFDMLMTRLESAAAPLGQSALVGADMYMKVFFDSYSPASLAVAGG